jgi:hypothetical protein
MIEKSHEDTKQDLILLLRFLSYSLLQTCRLRFLNGCLLFSAANFVIYFLYFLIIC